MMASDLLSVLMLGLCINVRQHKAMLTERPSNVVVPSGNRAMLECRTDSTASPVNWSQRPFNSKSMLATNRIFSDGEIPMSKRQRYQIESNNTISGMYPLVILNVTNADAGLYMCRDDRGFGSDAATAELVVIDDKVKCQLNFEHWMMLCILQYSGNLVPVVEWISMLDSQSSVKLKKSVIVDAEIAVEQNSEMSGSRRQHANPICHFRFLESDINIVGKFAQSQTNSHIVSAELNCTTGSIVTKNILQASVEYAEFNPPRPTSTVSAMTREEVITRCCGFRKTKETTIEGSFVNDKTVIVGVIIPVTSAVIILLFVVFIRRRCCQKAPTSSSFFRHISLSSSLAYDEKAASGNAKRSTETFAAFAAAGGQNMKELLLA